MNHPFWGTPIFGNTHVFLICFFLLASTYLEACLQNMSCQAGPHDPYNSHLLIILRGYLVRGSGPNPRPYAMVVERGN